jgi:hypothetical protein
MIIYYLVSSEQYHNISFKICRFNFNISLVNMCVVWFNNFNSVQLNKTGHERDRGHIQGVNQAYKNINY